MSCTRIVEQGSVGQATGSARTREGGLGWSIAAAATVAAIFMLSNSVTPLYAYWQSQWHFSSGLLTVVFATYMVGLIATLLIAGRVADRYGRKVVLVPGIIAAVVSATLFLAAQDVVWLLIGRLLAGAAVGAAVTAGMAATVDLAPAHRRRTGSLIASASMVFGAGIGPLVAGGIAQMRSAAPQHVVFGIVLAVELVALVISVLLPLRRPAVLPATRRFSLPRSPRENRRELRWGIGAFGPGITSTSFVLSLGPTVLRQSVHQPNNFLAGATACVMFLVATGVQFALSRLNTSRHLALSSAAAILSMIGMGLSVTLAPFLEVFVVAAVLAGVAQGLGQLAGLSLIATHVPVGKRAESNAVLNIGGYVPAGILTVAAGFGADTLGLAGAVVIFAVVLAVSAAVALVSTARSTRRHPAEAIAGAA